MGAGSEPAPYHQISERSEARKRSHFEAEQDSKKATTSIGAGGRQEVLRSWGQLSSATSSATGDAAASPASVVTTGAPS
jgi:hypothetical protein